MLNAIAILTETRIPDLTEIIFGDPCIPKRRVNRMVSLTVRTDRLDARYSPMIPQSIRGRSSILVLSKCVFVHDTSVQVFEQPGGDKGLCGGKVRKRQ